jgi:DNA invertase Pin-like site-specific DNA recombinase
MAAQKGFSGLTLTPRSTRQETRNKIYYFSMLYSARCCVAIAAEAASISTHLDTTTPTSKLLFNVTGAFSEFDRSMIRQRVNAGLSSKNPPIRSPRRRELERWWHRKADCLGAIACSTASSEGFAPSF